jgi:hypothetical protein
MDCRQRSHFLKKLTGKVHLSHFAAEHQSRTGGADAGRRRQLKAG